jgi:hypothetical protein
MAQAVGEAPRLQTGRSNALDDGARMAQARTSASEESRYSRVGDGHVSTTS